MNSIRKENRKSSTGRQKLVVFQQWGSAEAKISGIARYGTGDFDIEVVSIDESLAEVVDDTRAYLPPSVEADVVLDYLVHPDLSYDLCSMSSRLGVPVVASGKKHRLPAVYTPPT